MHPRGSATPAEILMMVKIMVLRIYMRMEAMDLLGQLQGGLQRNSMHQCEAFESILSAIHYETIDFGTIKN
jgi:hypothetical protein